ncbi:hypothetical protein NQ176_g4912 [Zarea fungicola]|uniref:Uncharacterized protein n=1 Tax=Zarea fungicola TaxID=93591 RepID=A0ACC1NCD1_9HYPO|nr:hypothetical protein NQ176_g4912 [Lecanicillium fungicola]
MVQDVSTLADQYFGSSPPLVSKRLCKKAAENNGDLTKAERWLFLCPGTVYGQFLADPTSLTDEQMSTVLLRPPLQVLAWNIKTTIGLDSIAEVLRDYWNPDRTAKLSYDAHEFITMGWWTFHSADIYQLCPKDSDEEIVYAAKALGDKLNAEELAFENAVRKSYCSGMERPEAEFNVNIEKEQKGNKSNEEWWVIAHDWREKNLAIEQDLRKKLRAQVNQELSDATDTDLATIKPLLQRIASEAAQEAAEARSQAEEEEREKKREEERWAEEKAHKRQLKAAKREENKNKKQKNEHDDAGSDDDADDDDDDDSDGSSDYIIKGDTRDYEKYPITREEVAFSDRIEAEDELKRQEAEASGWSMETNPYR